MGLLDYYKQFEGLSEEEVEKVRIGGLMHDLGKIAIEDKILRKPAPLTEVGKRFPAGGH